MHAFVVLAKAFGEKSKHIDILGARVICAFAVSVVRDGPHTVHHSRQTVDIKHSPIVRLVLWHAESHASFRLCARSSISD
jgi:hypothetical protein